MVFIEKLLLNDFPLPKSRPTAIDVVVRRHFFDVFHRKCSGLANEAGAVDDALGQPGGYEQSAAGISAPANGALELDEPERPVAVPIRGDE
jgi:hypothetical protein